MRQHNPSTRHTFARIRNRLAELQMQYSIADTLRQMLQNEIEAAAKEWFLLGGGNEIEFETKFNSK